MLAKAGACKGGRVVSDNPFNALFFAGDPRSEEFMLWLIDEDAEDQEEVIQKLAKPLYILLRNHSFAQRLHHKLYPETLEAEEKAGIAEHEWPVGDSAREFLDAWEREVKKPINGYVYFLQAVEWYGWVKIGRTTDINTRIQTLAAQYPFDTKLWHKIECADEIAVETAYHRKYADKRLRRGSEWFALTEEDLEEIRSVSYIGKTSIRSHQTSPPLMHNLANTEGT